MFQCVFGSGCKTRPSGLFLQNGAALTCDADSRRNTSSLARPHIYFLLEPTYWGSNKRPPFHQLKSAQKQRRAAWGLPLVAKRILKTLALAAIVFSSQCRTGLSVTPPPPSSATNQTFHSSQSALKALYLNFEIIEYKRLVLAGRAGGKYQLPQFCPSINIGAPTGQKKP